MYLHNVTYQYKHFEFLPNYKINVYQGFFNYVDL
jgi:hypothetical protein